MITEWFSQDPTYGLSLYTPEYYQHIWVSMRRVLHRVRPRDGARRAARAVPRLVADFQRVHLPGLRALAADPDARLGAARDPHVQRTETPVIFLTFLASFFATALNTMLGVESIDESYRARGLCLGANRWQVFRHVIVPGAMPFIFTGLQISVGVAWFSLVAARWCRANTGSGY